MKRFKRLNTINNGIYVEGSERNTSITELAEYNGPHSKADYSRMIKSTKSE